MMNMIEKRHAAHLDFANEAALLKALAHPTRLAILYLLRDGPHCVCHLKSYLGLRQAYISQQLSVLREAGLLQVNRAGWNIYYSVSDPAVFSILDKIQAMTGASSMSALTHPQHCPCPECQSNSKKS